MAEYIDRDEIRLKTCGDCTRHVDLACQHPEPCEDLRVAFLVAEPKDVAPVVHGRWELIRGGDFTSAFKCSVCGRRVSVSCDKEKTPVYLKDRYPYCNCGAKMDGGAM